MTEAASKKRKHAADSAKEMEEDRDVMPAVLAKSDDYYDTGGDLEIVSADGILFKVHSYHLQAASFVFRDMNLGAAWSRLELSDTTIENADTLTDMFSVIIHDRADWTGKPNGDADIASRGTHLISLLRKYDCHRALSQVQRHLESELSRAARDDPELLSEGLIFVFASIMGRYDICASALLAGGASWADGPGDDAEFGPLVDGSVTNPATLSLNAFRQLPCDYAWAWSRAQQTVFGAQDHSGRDDEVARRKQEKLSKEFTRLIKLIEADGHAVP